MGFTFNRPKFFLLFLLSLSLFLPPASAETLQLEPKKTGTALAVINLKWALDLQGQQVSELQVKSFGFSDYPSQTLISESTVPYTIVDTDKYGNRIREFNLDPQQNYQAFAMASEVRVSFGFDFPDAKDAGNYLKESRYVVITPEIRERAFQIASRHSTDMEKAIAIAEWVHNNVQYDRNYIEIVKGSDAVFRERAGTCDEFSHLFAAMLRAVGIPAKFSASYVYSGTDWGAHAFVEAAIEGKWIPFDPTFNEAILLDATHIKFGEGLDQQDIKEDIFIRSTSADISKIRLSREFDITFKETQNFPKLFDLQLQVPEGIVGERSLESVNVKIKNGGNRLAIPLSLLLPKEVEIPGENKFSEDRLVLLEPFEEKLVEWKVIIPELQEGYDYKFPVKLQSLGQDVDAIVHASKEGATQEAEELQVTAIRTIVQGGQMQLSVTVKNTGNVDSEGTISFSLPNEPQQQKSFSVPTGSEQTIGFTIRKPPQELVRGELLLEGNDFRLTQPFSLSFGPSVEPSDEAPSEIPTYQPTAEPPAGIPAEYLFTLAAMLLILGIFFLKAGK